MGEAVSIACDANSSKGVKPGDIPATSTIVRYNQASARGLFYFVRSYG
jgi:hypothetical protein